MKWATFLDILFLSVLIVVVWLHASAMISDFGAAFLAIPSMFYIMVLSDIIKKNSNKHNQ